MASEFARPDGDISTGAWTTTPLWSQINDVVGAGDATQIGSDNDATDAFVVTLSTITEPTGNVIIRWRSRKGATSGMTILEQIELLEGASTVRASYGPTAIPDSAAFSTRTFTLSTTQRDAITDWSNLRLRVTRTHTGTSNRNLRIADIELEGISGGGDPTAVNIDGQPLALGLGVSAGEGIVSAGVDIGGTPFPLLLDFPEGVVATGTSAVNIVGEPLVLTLEVIHGEPFAAVQPAPWDPATTFSAETTAAVASLWTGLVRSLPVWSEANAKTSYADDGTPTIHSGGGDIESWETGIAGRDLYAIRLDPALSALNLGTLDPADAGALFLRFKPVTLTAMGRLFGFSDTFEGRIEVGGTVYNDAFKTGTTDASDSDIAANVWWSLLFEWDKAVGVNRLYINNVLAIDQTGATSDPGSGTLSIGNRTGSTDPVDGYLAAAYVWSRNLTAGERTLVSNDPWVHHRSFAVGLFQSAPLALTLGFTTGTLSVLSIQGGLPTPRWYLLVDWDGTGWTDISGDAMSLSWKRGGSGEFGSGGEGTATVELRNADNKYLDTNTASPLYGKLRAGGQVFFAAQAGGLTYGLFSGYVKTLDPRASHIPNQRVASLVCEDALSVWARRRVMTLPAELDSIGLYEARTAVLDELGVPAAQRAVTLTNDPIVYGSLESFRDAEGATVTFEAGWTATPTAILNGLNDAGLGSHFIRPGDDESVPWVYVAIDRNHKVDTTPDASLTHLIGYSDMTGWRISDDTRVDYVVVRPRQPADQQSVEAEAGDPDSESQLEISNSTIPSLSAAQGIADHYQWRFRDERQRPQLTFEGFRHAVMFDRDLFDIVELTDERYVLTTRRMEIVGVSGRWGPGPHAQVVWTLQDAPQQPPLQKFTVIGRDVVGDATVVLGR